MENFQEVTMWYKLEYEFDKFADDFEGFLHDGKFVYKYNHLEEKRVDLYQKQPLPVDHMFKAQLGWEKEEWAKQYGYLIEGKVIPQSDLMYINEEGKIEFKDVE